eukprot:gene2846-2888_t
MPPYMENAPERSSSPANNFPYIYQWVSQHLRTLATPEEQLFLFRR